MPVTKLFNPEKRIAPVCLVNVACAGRWHVLESLFLWIEWNDERVKFLDNILVGKRFERCDWESELVVPRCGVVPRCAGARAKEIQQVAAPHSFGEGGSSPQGGITTCGPRASIFGVLFAPSPRSTRSTLGLGST